MTSGITKQALVRHRWSLLGPACTQVVGAGVIAVMLMATHSIDSSLSVAERQTPAIAGVTEMMSIFLGNARFLSVIVVGITMSLAATLQLHDMALLRSIGATPGQLRRCLVRQAAVVSVPASILGFLLAIPVGSAWIELLKSNEVLPPEVRFQPTTSALLVAIGVELVASVIGTIVAGLRPSRLTPARALVETTAGRGPLGRWRVVLGALLMGGGVVLSAVLSQLSATVADGAGIFILLGECVGVGLLGPLILRMAAHTLQPFAGNGLGRLALDDLVATSRSLSGALVPLVLATSFAVIQDGMLMTAVRATGVANSHERLMTSSGTASAVLFAGVAALNCLITLAVGRRGDLDTMRLAGGSRGAVLRIKAIQAGVFATTSLAISAGIALVTLVPLAVSAYGLWIPAIPFWTVVVAVTGAVGLSAVGIVAPAVVHTRRPATTLARANA